MSFLPVNYKSVVSAQSANGSWNDKLMKLIGQSKFASVADFIQSQTDEALKALPSDVILTVVGLKLLKSHFADNAKEWKLVASKGSGYIKKQGLALTLEQMMEKIIFAVNF